MVCNKCKVDYPIEKFDTYFHSGHNKHFTRKICNPCMRIGYKEYKLKVKLLSQPIPVPVIPDDWKQCSCCNKYKCLDDFYHSPKGTAFKNCKECHVINYKKKVIENSKDRGGSERVSYYPNTYVDKYQKEQTFWVMELMGWTYNDNGVWSKEGIKDKDKVWTNVIPTKKKRTGNMTGGRKRLPIHKKVDEVIRDYNEGNNFFDLATIYGCSHTTIRKLIRDYYGKTTG